MKSLQKTLPVEISLFFASLLFVLGLAGCGGETGSGQGAAGSASTTGGSGGGTSTGTGAGGTGGGPTCDSDCGACRSCALDDACAAALSACTASAACASIDACVSDCDPLSAQCVAACAAANPLGTSAYHALAACLLCESCASTCGGCSSLSCVNGVKDGDEAGVDCGGSACAPCGDGKPCGAGADCLSGFCVEGVCCEGACGGPCEACSAALTGDIDGACKPIPNNADPEDDCAGPDVCNGSGACRCGDGTVNGSETGMDCGGPVCGACPQGDPCNEAADCATGFCTDGVCCDSGCKGTCNACSAAKKGSGPDGTCGPIGAGLDPDDECASPAGDACNGASACRCFDGVQNGGETGIDCGGPTCLSCGGTCMNSVQDGGESDVDCGGASCPDCGAGKKCTVASDCASGFCADGVCCDQECTGKCRACTSAKTGQPTGTCGNVPSGQDPDNECSDQGAGSCGTDGSCGGLGSCRFYAQGSPCGDMQSCAGTLQTNADLCDGAGTCTDNSVTSCVPYVCGLQSACKSTCAADGDCSTGNYCAAPACVAKKANGLACGGTNQCQSGFCVDGVCCNAACGGTCTACTNAKTGLANGTCASIPSGQDPDSECANQGAASCGTSGACNGAAACALYPSGTPCLTTCAAQVQTNYTCNGGGSCLGSSTTPCGTYLCANASVCGATCATDAQCIPAAYCTAATCQPDKPNGQACATASQCQSGFCTGGVCCSEATCGPNATCGGGSCNCNGSYLNCNGGWGDGCEINGDSDNNNCGGCGASCQGNRYECCGAVCKDLCNPNQCGDCFGCPGAQCYGNVCGQACP